MPLYQPAGQPLDADLTTIAGLTATTDNFMQAKSSAWASRTPTQVTADLIVMVGDTGSGGAKGLVPAQIAGDATKFLRGDGTFVAIPGGGDALTANPLSQFAATTSLQLKNTISDETGSGALVFATLPTFDSFNLVTTSSSSVGVLFQNSTRVLHSYGTNNLFVGASSGNFALSGDSNIGLGLNTLTALTSGIGNAAFGKDACAAIQGGSYNFGVGGLALSQNVSGSGNVAVGFQALMKTTSDNNFGFGVNTLGNNVGGTGNVGMGRDVMLFNVSGNYNIAIGHTALYNNTDTGNIGIGTNALYANTSGNYSTAIGYAAGFTDTGANGNSTGVSNTYIGAYSGPASTTQRNGMITIGYKALANASYTCAIGGTAAAGTAVDLIMGGTTANAKAHFIKTTEQLRLGYDTTNYLSVVVGSNGNTDFLLVGTSPEFTFLQDVNVPDEAYASGWNGSTEVPTKNALWDKIETLGGGGVSKGLVYAMARGITLN